MLDDLGIKAAYSHDGAAHVEARPLRLLKADKSRYEKQDVLLLVRDPRDTVVSGYFQVERRLKMKVGSMSRFVRSDAHGIEKIALFNLQWLSAAKALPRFAVLRYEDLYRDTSGALLGVARFVGVEIAERRIGEVAAAYSFEKLRELEVTGALADRYGSALVPTNPGDPESFKVRKGQVGGYSEYLSAQDIAYCDAVLARADYWRLLDEALQSCGLA